MSANDSTIAPLFALIMALWTMACSETPDSATEAESRSTSESAAVSVSADELAAVMKTGEEAAGALVQTLGGQLQQALQSGGPVAAVEVCRQVAGPLTEGIESGRDGVQVRRVAERFRNPGNAPNPRDREVLGRMVRQLEAGNDLPEVVVEWSPETAHYYQPLLMKEVCLKCHGDRAGFSAELRAVLDQSYPDDTATGFALGDLRGAIRVDIERRTLRTDRDPTSEPIESRDRQKPRENGRLTP